MIVAALVVLGAVTAVLCAAMLLMQRAHTAERRMLVDRVIATHSGEVIALERAAQPRPPRPERVAPVAEGL